MTEATRRGFLAGATALPVAGAVNAADTTAPDRIAADLSTYIGFGNKRSGGAGNSACGHWLAAELERAGFAVDQLPISVPWFEGEDCEIALGDARAPLHPQPIVIPTPGEGVTGPLVRVDAHGKADAPLAGAIAQIGRAHV